MKHLIFLFVILPGLCNAQNSMLEWGIGLGTANSNQVKGVTIAHDHAGNVYIAGDYTQIADFDPGPGVVNLPFMDKEDNFIAKFNTTGNLLWAKGIGGNRYEYVKAIATDMSGNVYIMGVFQESVDFDPGPGTAVLTAVTNIDSYILKLDGAGNFMWVKSFGGPSGIFGGTSLTTDALGNVYATGYYTGTVDFDPGSNTYSSTATALNGNLFMLKLTSSGNFVWAKNLYGQNGEYGTCVAIDALGHVYIAGTYLGTVDFDPGPGVSTLSSTANGGTATFVLKLDSSGNFKWVRNFSGSRNTVYRSLTIDPEGNTYAAGRFEWTTDFDPGPGVYNLTATANCNAVILKMDSLGNFVWAKDFQVATGPYRCDIHSIRLDSQSNVYTIGRFEGKVDFDPGTPTFTMTGTDNVFIAKLEKNGDFLWAGNFNAPYSSSVANNDICALSIDASNVVYVSGNYRGTQDFDPGPGTYTLTTVNNYAPFLLKFKPGIVGVREVEKDKAAVMLYPNPNLGTFKIKLDLKNEQAELLLLDALGREIKRQALQSGLNDVVLKDYAPGLYYYFVLQHNKTIAGGKVSIN